MKVIKACSVVLLFNILIFNINAQTTVLKLWPDSIPGSIENQHYIEKSLVPYTDIPVREKVSNPSLYIFLPPADKATGAAVLICPGGGYGFLALGHEGFDIAKWLNDNGIAGIVLKYRLPSDLIMKDKSIGPLQDAQEAIRTIRRHASEWKIDRNKIGVIGFSAGGHLAATLATHYDERVYPVADKTSARPDFSILIYPVISFDSAFTHRGSRKNLIGNDPPEEEVRHFSNELQITDKTPPAFLVHSENDSVVPAKNSIVYFEGLQKFKIESELHLFQKGGHGYGLSVGKGTQSAWPVLCIQWLKELGLD
jgi:acetyl esterase/lipase